MLPFSAIRFVLLSAIFLFPAVARSSGPTAFSDVPLWAKEAVWYQIFPERFRNGDPKNDPTVSDIRGSWPHDEPSQWQISNWTADWYKLQSWELAEQKGFYFRAQQRRYGGDIQGIIEKLDYLKTLGVNAIYLNPLFESPSLHKYDATMYHHIDNNFGPNPAEDEKLWATENPADPATWKWSSADKLFLKLIREAHKRKIRVIIDGVFNHVGQTFWAFTDVEKLGPNSQYKNWFTVIAYDNPTTPQNEFDYVGWANVRELPELREDENGLLAPIRDHIQAIVKRWGDPNGDGNPSDGIDGWRLDVADKVAMPFWQDFRKWVRAVNPEAYIVGEVWWEDYGRGKMFNAEPWLRGDAFDAVMNYRWAREACYYFKGRNSKITVSEFVHRLDSLRNEYRTEVNAGLMNLYDSHDTDRLPSQIVNADTRYDGNVGVNDNREYDVRKPQPAEVQIQKLMVFFQMMYIGAPTIYYGDEAGMWGADDPDERKPMLWADKTYENERSHPFGKARPDDSNQFNQDLFRYYAKCVHLRRSSKALTLGDFAVIAKSDQKDFIVFSRSYLKEHAIVVINNLAEDQKISVPVPDAFAGLRWKNAFDSTKLSLVRGILTVTLPAKSGIVLQTGAKEK